MPNIRKVTETNLVLVQVPEGRMEFDSTIKAFLPPPFMADPMRYFDEQGKAIRTGEIVYKKNGRFSDPGSVRDFPVWRNSPGEELRVVCKRVNPFKSEV